MKKIFIVLMLALMSINVVSAAQQKQAGTSTQKVDKVEKADPKQDVNPVVGTLTRKNGQTYEIHRGPKGGEYYWRIASKGKHQGEWVKAYPSKEEKAQIKYKK